MTAVDGRSPPQSDRKRYSMNIRAGGALSNESRLLSEYIARACDEPLPGAVAEKTRHHILDTIAAMLSGSRLRAGKLAAGYVGRFAHQREANVIGTSLI